VINNVSIAVAYATVLGALLREAGLDNDNKPVMEMRKRIKKFLNERSRKNHKLYLEGYNIGKKAWNDTIDHFESRSLKIEAASAIISVWSLRVDILSRLCNLTEKVVEKFSEVNYLGDNTYETEANAREVAKYLGAKIDQQCI
jgi:hypothetical protein